MRKQEFVVGPGASSPDVAVYAIMDAVMGGRRVRVTLADYHSKRSSSQNAYLWGIVYPKILEHLPGWDTDDIHEYCLGSWSGWETIEGFGRKRLRPLKRSSTLTTVEFTDFIEHIQRTMAEKGIDVPSPNEYQTVTAEG